MAEDALSDRIAYLKSKGELVIDALQENGGRNQDGEWERAVAYQVQVLTFLRGSFGESHPYTQLVAEADMSGLYSVNVIVAALGVVEEDCRDGWLKDVQALATAEVFGDFLEMAAHLLKQGYKDAAAMLIGAVLEDGLRKIAARHGIAVAASADLNSMATQLLQKNIVSRLVRQHMTAWIALRNAAVHGHFDEYDEGRVETFLEDVRGFLTVHLQ